MHKLISILTYFFIILFISGCNTLTSSDNNNQNGLDLNANTIKKSPNDKREYLSFELPNKLEVLVISDPQTDKAAASMDVKVGSSHDPLEYAGLAHFLEHMLFLGTKKYPEPDAYQKFISEHGGYHNAYTSLEHTNYFFDVQAQHLEGALERFASQFTSPLFNPEYVEREVNAVHSEYTSKIKDDGRRYFSVLKELLNDKHPYSKFSVGNRETLNKNGQEALRQALLDFYASHYSSDKMKLVVLGGQTTTELKGMVEKLFQGIPLSPNSANQTTQNEQALDLSFFKDDFLPSKVQIETIKDTRTLSLIFPIPSSHEYQQEKPTSYLANLIGHEGEGSLLSSLKQQGLADTLSAGAQFDTGQEQLFVVRLGLTKEGLKNYQEIVNRFFDYVALLNNDGIKRLYFDEQAKMLDISFKFQEKSEPNHYVSALSNLLHEHEPEKVLYTPYDMSRFSPDLYKTFLSYLRPNNLLIALSAKELLNEDQGAQTDWYYAKYTTNKYDTSNLDQLQSNNDTSKLALPLANIFIPENVSFENIENQSKPSLLINEPNIELWTYPNLEFNTPKTNLFVTLRSPIANSSANNLNQTELMTQLLKDQLNEFSYPAYLAGLNYELYNHLRGITLKISGYSEKQSVLLETIISAIKTSQFDSKRFAIKKEKLQRKLNNSKKNKPFQQAIGKLQQYLISPSWSEASRLTALNNLNVEELQRFKSHFLSELDIAILSSGNISDESAKNYADLLKTTLLAKQGDKSVERANVVKLDDETINSYLLEVDHKDTGFVFYSQGADKSYKERAKFMLLTQLLASDYYNTIRTEKQLGYVVFATDFSLLEVPGIAFIVQSPDASAQTIYEETKKFLDLTAKKSPTWDKDTFERNRQAVLSKLRKKDNTLYERTNRYWRDLDKENIEFNTKERLASLIEAMDMNEITALVKKINQLTGAGLLIYTNSDNSETLDLPELTPLDNLSHHNPTFVN